jgi:hypothetical protein
VYLLTNRARCRNLVFDVTCGVPNLLHHLDCLLNRHIPRVSGLANEGHIRGDKCMAVPSHIDPVGKLFPSGFRITGLSNYELLDWR